MVRRRAHAVIPLLLLLPLCAHGEQPGIRLFTTDDGLVRNSVTSIRRDSLGRLWFCTFEGLSMFDGERFANYTTADGLPNRLVEDIAEAGDGWYWLATYRGPVRFRPRSSRPARFQPVEGDKDGRLSSRHRLLRMRNGT